MAFDFKFINGSRVRMLLVIEPASHEYWIASQATARISTPQANISDIDFEITPGGIVAYIPDGINVKIFLDDVELTEPKKTRKMVVRLDNPMR
ncbi:hypothetical protein HGO40_02830 [Pseudomonas sp. CG7]|uniref:hypothetical protein n=1 Tax=Pseudomonas sp. CG7 TaxID=191007 RepID=UPI0020332786|nr:hypothetical protein [Pseudomonas sp. CG7]MCM2459445.1 hypothetical protein [Pseudomonas sp. CG7]